MKLHEFLIKIEDQEEIPSEILKVLTTHCIEALEQFEMEDFCLYKGIDEHPTCKVTSPKERTSRLSNYYTLFQYVSNADSWSNLPRRNHSIICTTSRETAAGWGSIMAVFPFDNTKFGLCSSDDFNIGAFPYAEKMLNSHGDIGTRIDNIDSKLRMLTGYHKKNKDEWFHTVKKAYDYDPEKFKQVFERTRDLDFYEVFVKYDGDLEKLYDDILDPDKNGFNALTGMPALVSAAKKFDREVWFDNKCVFIPEHLLHSLENSL